MTFGKTEIDEKIEKLEQKEETKEAINFFKNNVKKVEIVRKDKLQFIYFPLLPHCRSLPE